MKLACMTLDLEPDCGGRVDSFENCERTGALEDAVSRYGIKLTTFVVGRMLDLDPDVVRRLAALGSEFEPHSYSHDTTGGSIPEEIRKSREAYVRYFGRSPLGYRGPQGRMTEEGLDVLVEDGFKFDASVFPSFRPGVFNNLQAPTGPFVYPGRDLVEIPFSVVPMLRLPIAHGYMRLLGEGFYHLLFHTFGLPEILVYDFHLHDLVATAAIRKLSPGWRFYYSRRIDRAQAMFERFVRFLKAEGYTFVYMRDIYDLVRNGTVQAQAG